MPRKKNPSAADALMELVSMMPWWLGVALAVVAYVVLHRLAQQPLVPPVDSAQVGAMATQAIWRGLATAGQYLLPIICLAGAGASALRRRERKALVANVVGSKAGDALDGMSWREFEKLVGEGFRLQGYQVVESGGGGADGGIDLVLSKRSTNGNEKVLVQCKQWRAFKVGVDVVRELYGVMAARGAAWGIVVTSGRFTEEATRFAEGRNVKLLDGPKLLGLIRQAQTAPNSTPTRTPSPAPTPPVERSTPRSVTCPLCSKPMIRRTAKKGPNAGNEFWGCTGYAACRGTRPIA